MASSFIGLTRVSLALLLGASTASHAFGAATSSSTFTTSLTPALRINEVLAANTRIAHGNTTPDMIELHNAGPAALDLAGKSLTDDPALPRKFVFPAGTTLAAGGYLVVYADSASSAPGLHLGFALDAEGDRVQLYENPAQGGTLIDEIAFGFQIPDYSVSRTGAAGNVWTLTPPTPGALNAAPAALGALDDLRINEWAGRIVYLLDHDLIELFNPAAQPLAIGGVRLTDDATRPERFVFPALSYIPANGFLALYGADFVFGLDGDRDPIFLLGANGATIDHVTLASQARDSSSGRRSDGGAEIVNFPVPTPGLPNDTALPAGYAALLAGLRITEIMYQPAATAGSSDFEFIELQNIGTSPLDLSGVRFTNGIDYTFPAGTSLAPGALIVVANDRSSFLSRYPGAASSLAPSSYSGSLDNTGETLALTLPAPWRVHILRFRFETDWYPSASGGGHSIVVTAPASTPPQDWLKKQSWRASSVVNGTPGIAEAPATGAQLTNLSVRTALPASETLIVGVVVSGGARTILVRAAGPALGAFGLTSAMPDPRLELYQGTTRIFENDDWPASLDGTFTSLGAFPFAAGSRDAALLQSVEGGRSIQTRGASPGVVLVEAYDAGGSGAARLVNVSARNRVGTGDDILIAGFAISGNGTKTLLIRAVGPGLAAFNLTGLLSDPKLEVYRGETKISENENWSATLAPVFESVGAFPLPSASKDAAAVVTLEPGSYTVQVRGSDGGSGEGLIEIYEVP